MFTDKIFVLWYDMIRKTLKGFCRMNVLPLIEYAHYLPADNVADYHPCSVGNTPRKEFMHKHDYCEVALVRTGEFALMSESLNTEFHGPCLVIFQKDRLHAQLDYSHTVYERYLLLLNRHIPPVFAPIVKQINNSTTRDITVIPLSEVQINWLYAILEHMRYLLEQEKASYKDERIEIPLRCLLEEIRCLIQSQPNASLDFCHLNIQYALSYINEHIQEKITVEALAAYMHCGKTKFNEDFKKYTGKSVHRYIVEERLALSKKYLKKDYPMSSIASLCGFRDSAHYIKTFQKYFAITPAQYRKKCNNRTELTIGDNLYAIIL